MEQLTWAFIGTIVGTIVGASASIFTTVITSSTARKLQQEAAVLERSEKAREFQRKNLLETQEALTVGMRLTGSAHLADMKSYRQHGESTLLLEELNQDIYNSNRHLVMLTERITDDSLRASIKVLREAMTAVLLVRTESESLSEMQRTTVLFEETMLLLGQVLRSNY